MFTVAVAHLVNIREPKGKERWLVKRGFGSTKDKLLLLRYFRTQSLLNAPCKRAVSIFAVLVKTRNLGYFRAGLRATRGVLSVTVLVTPGLIRLIRVLASPIMRLDINIANLLIFIRTVPCKATQNGLILLRLTVKKDFKLHTLGFNFFTVMLFSNVASFSCSK